MNDPSDPETNPEPAPKPDPKPKRGRPRTHDANKTRDVALAAYWRDDPADVSVNAICALAEVSKPALYRQFGSEDGLMDAVLAHYSEDVLADVFGGLTPETPLATALDAMIEFSARDPRMATGCVFYKMRAGRHRLGPKTRARIEEIEAAAIAGFTAYLEARRALGDAPAATPGRPAPEEPQDNPGLQARFLVEQVGLALMQRAGGTPPETVHATLALALSALRPV